MAGTGSYNGPFNPISTPVSASAPAALVYHILPALDSNPQRALTTVTVAQCYPAQPENMGMNISMLHPLAYLPPSGLFWNTLSPNIDLGGDLYCRTCIEPLALHDPTIESNQGFPCNRQCGLVRAFLFADEQHQDHAGQPCPKLYISMRSAKRHWKYNLNRQHWYSEMQCYPSRNQWAVLKANGYIAEDSLYDCTQTPVFTQKAWSLRGRNTSDGIEVEQYKHRLVLVVATSEQRSRKSPPATVAGFPVPDDNKEKSNRPQAQHQANSVSRQEPPRQDFHIHVGVKIHRSPGL